MQSIEVVCYYFFSKINEMYKDIISYKLAKGISEEHLISVSKNVIDKWMSKQKGFIKWEIHRNNENNYTDIVYWESKTDAKKSEKEMMNIPNASEWFACYEKGSITSENLSLIGKFS